MLHSRVFNLSQTSGLVPSRSHHSSTCLWSVRRQQAAGRDETGPTQCIRTLEVSRRIYVLDFVRAKGSMTLLPTDNNSIQFVFRTDKKTLVYSFQYPITDSTVNKDFSSQRNIFFDIFF